MKDFKLTISLLPKGAWNNDLSKTLPQKDWDALRDVCYKKANHKCEICGFETDDLDAHEEWVFDIENKTQILKEIIGICSKCHGVKHFKNSDRLGYGDKAKRHFMKVNNCSEMEFANHLLESVMDYDRLNNVYRWKMIADLSKFGLKNIKVKKRNIPFIENPYKDVDWEDYDCIKHNQQILFQFIKNDLYCSEPKIIAINVDNYQGIIQIVSDNTNKIEWYLDKHKIKTKYNVVGKFITTLKVEDLIGKELNFILFGGGGQTISKVFGLLPQEVI